MGAGASVDGGDQQILPRSIIPERAMRKMEGASSESVRISYGAELLRIVKGAIRSDSHLGSSEQLSGWQTSVKQAFILTHTDQDLCIIEEMVETYCRALESLLSNSICLVKSEKDLQKNTLLFFRKRHALELDEEDVGTFLTETYARLLASTEELKSRIISRFKSQLTVTIGMQLLLRSQEELIEGSANASKHSSELSLFESCFGSYVRKDQYADCIEDCVEALEGTLTLHGRKATDFVKAYIEDGNKGAEWSCPNCRETVNAKSQGSVCQNCGQECSSAFFAALTSPFDPMVRVAPQVTQGSKIAQHDSSASGGMQENHKGAAAATDTTASAEIAKPKPNLGRRDSEAGDFLDAVLSTKDAAVDLDATLTHNAGQFQKAFQAEIRAQEKELKKKRRKRRKEHKLPKLKLPPHLQRVLAISQRALKES